MPGHIEAGDLVRWMSAHGWSCPRLAERTGYSLRSVERYRAGQTPISEKFWKLAQYANDRTKRELRAGSTPKVRSAATRKAWRTRRANARRKDTAA